MLNPVYRFIYLRDQENFPVGCIAMAYNKTSSTVSVGVSTVHPKDKLTAYSKAFAKDLAVGRVVRSPVVVPIVPASDLTWHDIMYDVMEFLYERRESVCGDQTHTEKNKQRNHTPSRCHQHTECEICKKCKRNYCNSIDRYSMPTRVRKSIKMWMDKSDEMNDTEMVINVQSNGAGARISSSHLFATPPTNLHPDKPAHLENRISFSHSNPTDSGTNFTR
jgi:hypothetical protein